MSTTQQIQDRYWSKNQRRRRRPDHPVVRATFEPLADIVASAVDSPQEATVLDVGCGNGFLQWPLEHRFRSVTGIDASRQMLEVNPCEETLLGSCTDLPFVDKSFDVAVACHLLHHLAEPDRARTLAEMNRVARHAVVSFEPNRNNPLLFVLSLLKPAERMATQFSASYMRELFHDAGIAAVQVQTESLILHNTAPFWWVPIGRALEQTPLRELGFDICCVGQIGPWRGGGIP